MQVFYGTDKLPLFPHAVLTIGTFDGLHEGHRQILASVVAEARDRNGTSVLITFHPHPRKLIHPDEPLKLLSSLRERLALIAAAGVDVAVVVPFTHEFAALSATEYIESFLQHFFLPELIIIGYDHRFGHDRAGDINLLRERAPRYGFDVREIPAQLIQDAAVSSTKIRKALAEGRVADAQRMLGDCYQLSGRVSRGAQLGRTIGYPTANIIPEDPEKMVPLSGVYAVQVWYDEQYIAGGMMNIGINPTVSSTQIQKIEVHLFDFSGDLYDRELEVRFVARIRSEQKFTGLDALKAQLAQDEQTARQLLANA
ncbi:bifunctional riboflavin kinase/FAD synthetase [Rurimicrobium arvi]|uniref:Riboflavin biosynthesis protein n=1 Tax=Rurimicrobium arvi TaxID=2049916 RepID=A0ABP8N3L8_9BACT